MLNPFSEIGMRDERHPKYDSICFTLRDECGSFFGCVSGVVETFRVFDEVAVGSYYVVIGSASCGVKERTVAGYADVGEVEFIGFGYEVGEGVESFLEGHSEERMRF